MPMTIGNATHAIHERNRLRGQARERGHTLFHRFFDDFDLDTGGWSIVGTNPNSIAGVDRQGSWITLTAGTSDNDESYARSVSQGFICNTTDNILFSSRIRFARGGILASYVIGLAETVGADLLDDAEGQFTTTNDAIIFNAAQTGNIQFITSNGTSQTIAASAATHAESTDFVLEFLYVADPTTASVVPIVNGVAGTAHNLTVSGMGEMYIV